LKYIFPEKLYGFIVADIGQVDIFFHFEDMKDTGLTVEDLLMVNQRGLIYRYAFGKLSYYGKNGKSVKAINIDLIESINKKTGERKKFPI
jgi:hypothetical protein